MVSFIVGFLVGLFIGTTLGVFIAALAVAARNNDEAAELVMRSLTGEGIDD